MKNYFDKNEIDQYQKEIIKQQSKILQYKQKLQELNELLQQKRKRNLLLEKEFDQKLESKNAIVKWQEIDREMEMNEIILQNNETKTSTSSIISKNTIKQDNKIKKQNFQNSQQKLEQYKKLSFEFFSNQLEKYFSYIETCLENEFNEEKVEIIDPDKYYIPPMIRYNTILVYCCIKLFKKNVQQNIDQNTADDSEYVCATFRYQKQDTFDNLKIACLLYWEIIQPENSYVPDTFNIVSNYTEMKAKKYQFFTPDSTLVMNTDLIERYCDDFENKFDKEKYINVILKKRFYKAKPQQNNKDQQQNNSKANQLYSRTLFSQSLVNQTLFTQQEESMNDQVQNSLSGDLSLDDVNFTMNNILKRMKESLLKRYLTFIQRFPLLQKMFQVDTFQLEYRDSRTRKQLGLKIDDYNILYLILLIILLLLNSLQLGFFPYQPVIQSHINQLKDNLSLKDNDKFYKISQKSEVMEYFNGIDGFPFQICSNYSKFNLFYDTVGAMRFRVVKVKQKTCDYPVRQTKKSTVKCVNWGQNIDSLSSTLLSDGSQPWMQFQSVLDVGITRNIVGKFGTYDQSGYINDLSKSNQNLLKFRQIITKDMFQNPAFLNYNTLILVVSFCVKSRVDENFFFIELLFENTNIGVYPNKPTIIPFRLLDLQGIVEQIKIIAGFKLFFSICLVFYQLAIIYNTIKEINSIESKEVQLKHYLQYFISILFITNFIIIVSNFINITQTYTFLGIQVDASFLIQYDGYLDFGEYASQFQYYYFILSITIAFMIIRLVLFFCLSKGMMDLIQSIQLQYLQIIVSFMILLLILLSFSLVLRSLQGPYTSDFSSFAQSFTNLMRILMNSYNVGGLLQYNQTLTIIFFTFFYFLLIFFVFNMIIVIYIDSYRQTILKGDIMIDKKNKNQKYFLKWLLYWTPQRFQDYIYNKFSIMFN